MSSESATPSSQDPVIQCHDLGKCYQIYDSPKARLKQAFFRGRRQYFREFWALRDVSFEVKRGESLGIIGRNGSGKSTLLQLTCGTLTPTEGRIQTSGRIAALLELGSGFNPEFTGIENVYLNASMLGLSKQETDARLDEILAFADIGDFIDQPVKSYSSGMGVRLAFAVIAHVDADILVVDEALAVGDAVFVQRCMRFIRRMRDEKCLLFVSHDAEAVKSLCSQAMWLSHGRIESYGACRSVALNYLRYCQAESHGEEYTFANTGSVESNPNQVEDTIVDAAKLDMGRLALDYSSEGRVIDNFENASGWKTGSAELTSISLRTVDSPNHDNVMRGGELAEVEINAVTHIDLKQPILGFVLKDRLGQCIFGENTLVLRETSEQKEAEAGSSLHASFRFWFPMLPSGSYSLMASIADGSLATNTQHHWLDNSAIVIVSSSRVRYGLAGAFITNIDFSISSVSDHVR